MRDQDKWSSVPPASIRDGPESEDRKQRKAHSSNRWLAKTHQDPSTLLEQAMVAFAQPNLAKN
jgi:hypothetical protein